MSDDLPVSPPPREPKRRQKVICPRCEKTVGLIPEQSRTYVHDCEPANNVGPYDAYGFAVLAAIDLGTGEPILPDTRRRQLRFDGAHFSHRNDWPPHLDIAEALHVLFFAYDQAIPFTEALAYQQVVSVALADRLDAVFESLLARYPRLPTREELEAELEAAFPKPPTEVRHTMP
jgi:hypothetical protein